MLGTRYKMLSSKKKKQKWQSVYRKVSVFLFHDVHISKDHYSKRKFFDSTEN